MLGIMSLLAEKNNLQFAVPGGLIGVGTKIDPKLTRGLAASPVIGHETFDDVRYMYVYIE